MNKNNDKKNLKEYKSQLTRLVDQGVKKNLKESDPKKKSELFTQLEDQGFEKIKLSPLDPFSKSQLSSWFKNHLGNAFNFSTEVGKNFLSFLVSFNEIKDELKEKGIEKEIKPEQYQKFIKNLPFALWTNPQDIEKHKANFISTLEILSNNSKICALIKEHLENFYKYVPARSMKRKVIYHAGPTNSGKTYHAIQALIKAKNGLYLAPLRLLANELYETLSENNIKTTLLTGEEVIEHPEATHVSSTVEMANYRKRFSCVVIDEIQMLSDKQRGWAWTKALLEIQAEEIHVCGDPSCLSLVEFVTNLLGDTLEVVRYERKTSLNVLPTPAGLDTLQAGDAVVVFSRRKVLKAKEALEKLGHSVAVIYGMLTPEVRREQSRLFCAGTKQILVSTDAIGMGLNLPIRRVFLPELTKFDGEEEYPVLPTEIKQIAGRAGRFNLYPEGFVGTLKEFALHENPKQAEEKAKKYFGGSLPDFPGQRLSDIRSALDLKLAQKDTIFVGPDEELFELINEKLKKDFNFEISLSKFFELFEQVTLPKPFFVVDLSVQIDLAKRLEIWDKNKILSQEEMFGFAIAPVMTQNEGHIAYWEYLARTYLKKEDLLLPREIKDENDLMPLEQLEELLRKIELYQWLKRHFKNKHQALFVASDEEIKRIKESLTAKVIKKLA